MTAILSLDHVILGCASLDEGMDWVVARTGVRPEPGGKHPTMGTHNALVSLGAPVYLEVLALDPHATTRSGPLSSLVSSVEAPRFIAWAAATTELITVERLYTEAGIPTAGIRAGQRTRADGTILRWKSLMPLELKEPAIPFAIEWDRDSIHPSHTSPGGCRLKHFSIRHPEADRIRTLLNQLRIEVEVFSGATPELVLEIESPNGKTVTVS